MKQEKTPSLFYLLIIKSFRREKQFCIYASEKTNNQFFHANRFQNNFLA